MKTFFKIEKKNPTKQSSNENLYHEKANSINTSSGSLSNDQQYDNEYDEDVKPFSMQQRKPQFIGTAPLMPHMMTSNFIVGNRIQTTSGNFHYNREQISSAQLLSPPVIPSSFNQPIEEWDCDQVAQWLTINDMSLYMDSFLEKEIDGEKLIALDNAKLKVIEHLSGKNLFNTFNY